MRPALVHDDSGLFLVPTWGTRCRPLHDSSDTRRALALRRRRAHELDIRFLHYMDFEHVDVCRTTIAWDDALPKKVGPNWIIRGQLVHGLRGFRQCHRRPTVHVPRCG